MGSGFMGLHGTPWIYGAGILWGQGLWGLFDPIDLGLGFMGLGFMGFCWTHRFMGPGFMGPFGTP